MDMENCPNRDIKITRGTTPTITYSFRVVDPADFAAAQFIMKQGSAVLIEKNLSDAVLDSTNNTLSFTLTQADTLQLEPRTIIYMKLRFRQNDGKAGASRTISVAPDQILKEGEI